MGESQTPMNEKLAALTISKSAKRIQSELSLTNTNSIDTNNEDSLFSDSETSLFSKSKSLIFLNEEEEDEVDGNGDGDETETKKEDDEATIREYEEYIKKHNRRKKKKKRGRSKSKRKYNSPLVITESNSSHLWDLYSFEDAPTDLQAHHQALYEELTNSENDNVQTV